MRVTVDESGRRVADEARHEVVMRRLVVRVRVELEQLLEHAEFVLAGHPVEVVVADGAGDRLRGVHEVVELDRARDRGRQEQVSKIVERPSVQVAYQTYKRNESVRCQGLIEHWQRYRAFPLPRSRPRR